jgi:hypothetical protein
VVSSPWIGGIQARTSSYLAIKGQKGPLPWFCTVVVRQNPIPMTPGSPGKMRLIWLAVLLLATEALGGRVEHDDEKVRHEDPHVPGLLMMSSSVVCGCRVSG